MAATVSKGKWKLAPHLTLLDRKLVDVAHGRIKRLLITMPPRHGKSQLTSRYFPAWFLGNYPDKEIILASYGQQFASRWGRQARNILHEHGPQLFGVNVAAGAKSSVEWEVDGHDGRMVTAGVGGAVTGKGAHLMIVDDPVKNREEANSATYRENTWDWWTSTAYTRLEPGGACIGIQTRWHVDDWAGRILAEMKNGGEQWEVLDLPAIAGENDPLGRKEGEALWPARYDVDDLTRIKRAVGTQDWLSLYQQKPVLEGGNKIKATWFRYWERHGDYLRLFDAEGNFKLIEYGSLSRFVIIDAAGSSEDVRDAHKGKHSWSVAQHWGITRQGKEIALVCLDQIRGQWEFPDLKHRVREFIDTHKPAWSGAEDEKTGRALNQELRRSGYTIKSISHEGKDKLTRAARLLVLLENGQVFYPRGAKWLEDYREECVNWTGDKDDQADQIDASAYAALQTVSSSMGSWGGVVSPRQTGLRYGMAF